MEHLENTLNGLSAKKILFLWFKFGGFHTGHLDDYWAYCLRIFRGEDRLTSSIIIGSMVIELPAWQGYRNTVQTWKKSIEKYPVVLYSHRIVDAP